MAGGKQKESRTKGDPYVDNKHDENDGEKENTPRRLKQTCKRDLE